MIEPAGVFRYTAAMGKRNSSFAAAGPGPGWLVLGLIALLLPGAPAVAAAYADVVIQGARVIDPESGLAGVRDVAIVGGAAARQDSTDDQGS